MQSNFQSEHLEALFAPKRRTSFSQRISSLFKIGNEGSQWCVKQFDINQTVSNSSAASKWLLLWQARVLRTNASKKQLRSCLTRQITTRTAGYLSTNMQTCSGQYHQTIIAFSIFTAFLPQRRQLTTDQCSSSSSSFW